MRKRSRFNPFYALLVVALIAGVIYFSFSLGTDEGAKAQEGQKQAMPAPVMTVKKEPIRIWKDFSARLEAVEEAEIRPRVSGQITEVFFEDGQIVEQGDVLFVIDPRPFRAEAALTEAEVKATENQLRFAEQELKRAEQLVKTKALSQRIYDQRLSDRDVAKARLLSAEAALDRARLNLDYAHVQAPISGRTSQVEVKKGNLVEAGSNAPLLTRIVSNATIYAEFEIDEQTYVNNIRAERNDSLGNQQAIIPVEMTLASSDALFKGAVYSLDNQIDVTTGTIRARALFNNSDGALLPGMFSTVRLGSPTKETRVVVDERAIGTDQDRKFVYVVGPNNILKRQVIKIGDSIRGQRIVKKGLNGGESVVVGSLFMMQPGMPVSPYPKEQASQGDGSGEHAEQQNQSPEG